MSLTYAFPSLTLDSLTLDSLTLGFFFTGAREQLNQVTSFVDASNVYGSSEKEANELREANKGNWKNVSPLFVHFAQGILERMLLIKSCKVSVSYSRIDNFDYIIAW